MSEELSLTERCRRANVAGFEQGSLTAINLVLAWLERRGVPIIAEALLADWDAGRMVPAPIEAQPLLPFASEELHPFERVSPTDIDPAPAVKMGMAQAKGSGYTGNECTFCHSMRMTISGHCEKCEDCGESSGCS